MSNHNQTGSLAQPLSFEMVHSTSNTFCEECAAFVPGRGPFLTSEIDVRRSALLLPSIREHSNPSFYDADMYGSSPVSESRVPSQTAFVGSFLNTLGSPHSHQIAIPAKLKPDSQWLSTVEVNERVAQWAEATAVAASQSSMLPSPPSSYDPWPSSESVLSFSSASSSEYHDAVESFPPSLKEYGGMPLDPSRSNTADGQCPPISDVLASGSDEMARFQQEWNSSFSVCRFAPGHDSVKEAFAVILKAQEVLLMQTAFLEVHLGQQILNIHSIMKQLTQRKALLRNTFQASRSLQTWVSVESPEIDMHRVAGDYISDHDASSDGRPLLIETDQFLIGHVSARTLAAEFLRDPAAVWAQAMA